MPRRTVRLRVDDVAARLGSTAVRTRQLEGLGLHRATVAHRCRPGGPWRSLLPGVVLLHNAPPTRDDRRRGALLHAGPGAVLTGLDALELAGSRSVPRPTGPVHVLVPADRHRTGNEVALIERTARLPDAVPGRWPAAPVARSVLDFARRTRDRNQVRAALAEVVQRGWVTPAALAAELEAGSGRGSALPRAVLAEVGDGVRSAAEAQARELVRRGRLPTPLWNPRLLDVHGRLVAVPDAWFDDAGVAWEIDSREWHLSPADYDRTLDRRSAMMAEGITVLHTQPSKLRTNAPQVCDELTRIIADAAHRPRPRVWADPTT